MLPQRFTPVGALSFKSLAPRHRMIDRYNRTQIARAVFAGIGGLLCCYLAYLFFKHVPAFVASQFGHRLASSTAMVIGLLGLTAVFFSGYRVWQRRGGLYSYHESALYHDFGGGTAGAVVGDFYAHRVTGPAYIISQIFLAGPLLASGPQPWCRAEFHQIVTWRNGCKAPWARFAPRRSGSL